MEQSTTRTESHSAVRARPSHSAFFAKVLRPLSATAFATSVVLTGCGGVNSQPSRETTAVPTPSIGARAWATVGKEIVDAVGAAWMHPNPCDSNYECPITDPISFGSSAGRDGIAVLDILCPLGKDALAPSPASATEFARACDLAGTLIIDRPYILSPDSYTEGHFPGLAFRGVDEALVLAGANDQPISDSARRSVLLTLLSRIFEYYRSRTPYDDRPHQLLQYVCPSMLSDGAASKEACEAVARSFSWDGGTPQPEMVASILAELAGSVPAIDRAEPSLIPSTVSPTQTVTQELLSTPEPPPLPNACGEGPTPEDAISGCTSFQPYGGDCELGQPGEESCSSWVDRLGDLRLYFLSAPPDGLASVLLQHRQGGWIAAEAPCEKPASRATPDFLCRPVPFTNLRAQYSSPGSAQSNGKTEFGVRQIDILGDGATVRVFTFFRNIGTSPVPWTSDEGVDGIYLTDSSGGTYPSTVIGGHVAEDLRDLLPGESRSGWYDFEVGAAPHVFTLTYPLRAPVTLDLTGTPLIQGLE